MRFAVAIFALATLLAGCSDERAETTTPSATEIPLGSGFDFYVLALSWSPGYCASEGARGDKNQCQSGRAYQFVVHGLWPQFTKGYPANCDSAFGEKVDNRVIKSMLDIMPSYGLIKHQWRKHGRCSGLSQQDYFDVTRAAYDTLKTPPSFEGLRDTVTIEPLTLEKLFQAENPDIPADGIAVTCKNNYLRDVRICLSKDLAKFLSCPEVDRNFCRTKSVAVPPVR